MTLRVTIIATVSLIMSATMVLSQNIHVGQQYARVASPIAKSGAVFLHIMNMGDEDDTLIAARTGSAKNPQLHLHFIDDEVAKMREIEGGILVPAGETVMLERSGMAVMLMGLTHRFEQGGVISLTLVFEKAGEITIEVPIDNERQDTSMDHSTMDHSTMDHSD